MAQQTSIQQAARNALAAWLRAELAMVGDSGVTVEPRWFEADRPLTLPSISIIDAGPRRIEWLDPDPLAQTSVGSTSVLVTWKLGFVDQRVQLDVWAASDLALDDIVARLDGALNAGDRPLGESNVMPVEAGLTCNLADGWAPGVVQFFFDEPDIEQTAASVGEGEWRATYRGTASALLTQQALSPKLARVLVNARLRNNDPADPTDAPDVTIITPNS